MNVRDPYYILDSIVRKEQQLGKRHLDFDEMLVD